MEKYLIRKRKHSAELDNGESVKCEDESKLEKDEDSVGRSKVARLASSATVTSVSQVDHVEWRKIRGENLKCDYCIFYERRCADELLRKCEEILEYNEGKLTQVHVFGSWHNIPRKQVAHGDEGLAYNFSNNSVPARPWIPLLQDIRDAITQATGYSFNFVLINRYKDGHDHMGEHRDDEKDLVAGHPIASLSLGQPRDFVFKHADTRGKNATRKIAPVKLELQHGSLLMMKHPTNTYWYHSLPSRKKLTNIRINMTFRKMVVDK